MNSPATPILPRPLAEALLAFYHERGADRGLPWRRPLTPPELRVLVEGLLVRTRAEAVGRRWRQLLGDLEGADGWLDLPVEERLRRAGLLGRGREKRQIVDGLAHLVVANRGKVTTSPIEASHLPGEVAYCVGMYRLLLGLHGGPVDEDTARVAMRYGCDAGRLAAGITHGAVDIARDERLAAAIQAGTVDDLEASSPVGLLQWGEPPAPYRAFSALLDVGTLVCTSRRPPACSSCPLSEHCRRAVEARARVARRRSYVRKDRRS